MAKEKKKRMTFAQMKEHVLYDVRELIATLGLLSPIAFCELDRTRNVLRGMLFRNVVLVLGRMLEKPCHGKTGETASVPALLKHTDQSHFVGESSQTFARNIEDLKEKLKHCGTEWSDVIKFRDSQIAHSLGVWEPLPASFGARWILEFAYHVRDLVERIDKATADVSISLDADFDGWIDRGREFWIVNSNGAD